MKNIFEKVKKFYFAHNTSSTRLMISLVSMAILLSGSCETSAISGPYFEAYGQKIAFKENLFPKASIIEDSEESHAHMAYVSRARSIVQNDPKALMKLNNQEISYLFGKPTFSRKDADARVWQYKTNNCVIDVYFYEEGKGAQSPVSYVDMRFKEELFPGSQSKTSVSQEEQSRCLQDVVAMSDRSNSRV